MHAERSFTLDAMRGVAALSVVARHLNTVLPAEEVQHSILAMPNGYLGVDFFFMLSGFVMARAYEHKLKAGLSVPRFMEWRLIRLYPMFLLGILLGAAMIAGQIVFHARHALDPAHAVLAFAQNVLMVPDFASGDQLYTLNLPAWTLLFEVLINLAFGLVLFRLGSVALTALALASAAIYFWGHVRLGDGNLGLTWATVAFGFARIGYAFPMGMVLGRAFSSPAAAPSPWAAAVPLALAWIFFLGPSAGFQFSFDAACLFFVLPLTVWLGARLQPPRALRRVCEALGDASYPLFVIHFPLLHIAYRLFARMLGVPGWLVVLAFVPAVFLLAWLIFHRIDVPVRRWLGGLSRARAGAMPAAP